MTRICMYCRKILGTKKGGPDSVLTHGCCDPCARRILEAHRLTTERTMRHEDAARRYRVMSFRPIEDDLEHVAVGDLEGLLGAPTFEQFLAWNRIRIIDGTGVVA